ncbi:paired amphipathic helix protein Sin3-like 4 [Arabidopsis lyrata subsp. lyrata]|uniref:paired amphipathic helix protein Sin3-like 4 n=1 Tax=Arabidopsis lyrata subsp. lyrata TaxID=81972 RepID=UPI000A29CE12|nr:paired amphipathic helix protein Sin3-like 4 [Arabidopsis lyrata subsp. lyrata]|eukprot:XP_020875683.1 paired amphipathic helix protein Sin3-like 4 [Arabidopsis lyrata subsp. lyrata]
MSAPKPTKINPRKYLKIVKNKLQNKRDIYVRFLQVMTAYTAHRIDPNGVKSVVKELFKEDQELISGFNTFLPKGFEITLNCEQTPPTNFIDVEYSEALDFVRKVKKKFQDDDRIYKSFVNILDMYRKKNMSLDEVCHEVYVCCTITIILKLFLF